MRALWWLGAATRRGRARLGGSYRPGLPQVPSGPQGETSHTHTSSAPGGAPGTAPDPHRWLRRFWGAKAALPGTHTPVPATHTRGSHRAACDEPCPSTHTGLMLTQSPLPRQRLFTGMRPPFCEVRVKRGPRNQERGLLTWESTRGAAAGEVILIPPPHPGKAWQGAIAAPRPPEVDQQLHFRPVQQVAPLGYSSPHSARPKPHLIWPLRPERTGGSASPVLEATKP